eukprot:gene10518-2026_t
MAEGRPAAGGAAAPAAAAAPQRRRGAERVAGKSALSPAERDTLKLTLNRVCAEVKVATTRARLGGEAVWDAAKARPAFGPLSTFLVADAAWRAREPLLGRVDRTWLSDTVRNRWNIVEGKNAAAIAARRAAGTPSPPPGEAVPRDPAPVAARVVQRQRDAQGDGLDISLASMHHLSETWGRAGADYVAVRERLQRHWPRTPVPDMTGLDVVTVPRHAPHISAYQKRWAAAHMRWFAQEPCPVPPLAPQPVQTPCPGVWRVAAAARPRVRATKDLTSSFLEVLPVGTTLLCDAREAERLHFAYITRKERNCWNGKAGGWVSRVGAQGTVLLERLADHVDDSGADGFADLPGSEL